MRDFGEWMRDIGKEIEKPEPKIKGHDIEYIIVDDLVDDLVEVECCVCEVTFNIDIADYEGDIFFYCGGSPRCCP